MSIHLNKKLCQGCRACLSICPGYLLSLGPDQRVQIEEPERCWGCAACLKRCPHQALGLYLPPALGGRGILLTVVAEKTSHADPESTQSPTTSGYRLRWRAQSGSFVREIVTEPGHSQGY
ncbi:MAG: 4Fe-4S dicluster domain-containing protein [Deltaproteobacteria bacterium]|nr:4Fe-4S dicluster domain-containing protein [Deltaproteobacteria bacterium]